MGLILEWGGSSRQNTCQAAQLFTNCSLTFQVEPLGGATFSVLERCLGYGERGFQVGSSPGWKGLGTGDSRSFFQP